MAPRPLYQATDASDITDLMATRNVSGRYRHRGDSFDVELRVDVDGPRATNRVSADYHRVVAGGETVLAGSMRVDEPVLTAGDERVMISGAAVFSFPTRCTQVEVTIPRVPFDAPAPAPATLAHVAAPGAPGVTYECAFESASFRTVELEEAYEPGVEPFRAYDTASLPAPGAPQTLTHLRAFAEAGIEMRPTGPPTAIHASDAGPDATWNDAELQAAMQEHFSRWGDRPRWAIWLLHAASHDDPQVSGLMFDQRGLQRQGCAVFYGRKPRNDAETVRNRLHACVHELGHGFNLQHCWQRSLTDPPLPSRPEARSWMNYPERFPGGVDAYWADFEFRFDDAEHTHLRHGFEDNVIMGGSPFGAGSAGGRTPAWDTDDTRDPGLRLTLDAPIALVEEMPVTVRLELAATSRGGRPVPATLGPRAGTVDIAIRRPGGSEFVFEPLLWHCRGDEAITLRHDEPPLRDWAFIHYGRKGFSFAGPGRYLVRARYAPPDGPVVLSNVASVQVTPAQSLAGRRIARLIAGDDQVGTLMSLMGSDARALREGSDKLRRIARAYPAHPLGAVARLVEAANLARGFKRLRTDGTVGFRAPRLDEAVSLVADLVDVRRTALLAARAASLDGRQPRSARTPLVLRRDVDAAVRGFANSRPDDVLRLMPGAAERVLRRRGLTTVSNP